MTSTILKERNKRELNIIRLTFLYTRNHQFCQTKLLHLLIVNDLHNKHLYSFMDEPVRIRVRIDPPYPHVCRKRRLIGAVLRIRQEKFEVPCHNRCGTIKIPPCSKALSAEQPKFLQSGDVSI
jgi:hypothetical protein